MHNYPQIRPAIYVWEYDQGQYVDINANEILCLLYYYLHENTNVIILHLYMNEIIEFLEK